MLHSAACSAAIVAAAFASMFAMTGCVSSFDELESAVAVEQALRAEWFGDHDPGEGSPSPLPAPLCSLKTARSGGSSQQSLRAESQRPETRSLPRMGFDSKSST